jgi:hypothetical protein
MLDLRAGEVPRLPPKTAGGTRTIPALFPGQTTTQSVGGDTDDEAQHPVALRQLQQQPDKRYAPSTFYVDRGVSCATGHRSSRAAIRRAA